MLRLPQFIVFSKTERAGLRLLQYNHVQTGSDAEGGYWQFDIWDENSFEIGDSQRVACVAAQDTARVTALPLHAVLASRSLSQFCISWVTTFLLQLLHDQELKNLINCMSLRIFQRIYFKTANSKFSPCFGKLFAYYVCVHSFSRTVNKLKKLNCYFMNQYNKGIFIYINVTLLLCGYMWIMCYINKIWTLTCTIL